eukprot:1126713-Rhodomonas_salina.1
MAHHAGSGHSQNHSRLHLSRGTECVGHNVAHNGIGCHLRTVCQEFVRAGKYVIARKLGADGHGWRWVERGDQCLQASASRPRRLHRRWAECGGQWVESGFPCRQASASRPGQLLRHWAGYCGPFRWVLAQRTGRLLWILCRRSPWSVHRANSTHEALYIGTVHPPRSDARNRARPFPALRSDGSRPCNTLCSALHPRVEGRVQLARLCMQNVL